MCMYPCRDVQINKHTQTHMRAWTINYRGTENDLIYFNLNLYDNYQTQSFDAVLTFNRERIIIYKYRTTDG